MVPPPEEKFNTHFCRNEVSEGNNDNVMIREIWRLKAEKREIKKEKFISSKKA